MRLRTNVAAVGLVVSGLIAIAVLGAWKAVADLPPISAPPPDLRDGHSESNWFGYSVTAAYAFGLLLLVVIYAGKRWIIRLASGVPARILWYCLGVACSLPYIWFLVVMDWRNPFIYRVSCWVYDPIAIWAVPTVSFAWDVARGAPCTSKAYLLRSAAEIVLVVPAWIVLWMFFSFFFLRGGWI